MNDSKSVDTFAPARRALTSCLAALAVVAIAHVARAQFVETSPAIPGSPYPCLAVADYDLDGDPDVLFAGTDSQDIPFTKLYRNQAGAYVDSGITLVGLSLAHAAWGDFDGDGDPDLALSGLNVSNVPTTRVYRNNGGTFTQVASTFLGSFQGVVAWGDYDVDGDLDLLVTGAPSTAPLASPDTRLYRNDAGNFVSVAHPFHVTVARTTQWIDYDLDGDDDLLLCGAPIPGDAATVLYTNLGGTFVESGASLSANELGFAEFGDYDADGDPDLLIGGITNNGYESVIYRNEAGTFTNIQASLVGLLWVSAGFADYDQDGDLDAVIAGYEANAQVNLAVLYRNDGGTFVDSGLATHPFSLGQLEWLDSDGDGDADLLLAGNDQGNDIVKLYRNDVGHSTAFCFGDGTLADHTTPCPCGNNGAPGHGCGHSFDPNGALLTSTGTMPANDVVLHSAFEPASAFTLFLQHSAAGDGVFHDGTLCAGGTLIRLRGRAAVGGAASFPNSLFAIDSTTTLSQRGGVTPGSGARRYYSAWFRNASTTFCPPATANVTNGLQVDW